MVKRNPPTHTPPLRRGFRVFCASVSVMGKNQEKRIEKTIAHARMVWAREQIQAAAAMKVLDEAWAEVEANSSELDAVIMQAIEHEYESRKEEVKRFLLDARDKFVAKVGEDNADLGVDFDVQA